MYAVVQSVGGERERCIYVVVKSVGGRERGVRSCTVGRRGEREVLQTALVSFLDFLKGFIAEALNAENRSLVSDPFRNTLNFMFFT